MPEWPKEQGILRIAKRALHLEMPAHRVFYNPRARQVYTAILAELIRRITTPRLDSIAAQPSTFAARVSAP